MSWAEEQAARIRQSQDQRKQAQEWQIQRSAILNRDSNALWEDLVAHIRKELEDFKALVPAATRLRVYQISPQNPNGFTIDTIEQPLIKITFLYDSQHKTVRATGHRQHGFGGGMTDIRVGPFRIDVDPSIGVTFVMNGQSRGACQVAEEFMKPIGDFFAAPPSISVRVTEY